MPMRLFSVMHSDSSYVRLDNQNMLSSCHISVVLCIADKRVAPCHKPSMYCTIVLFIVVLIFHCDICLYLVAYRAFQKKLDHVLLAYIFGNL